MIKKEQMEQTKRLFDIYKLHILMNKRVIQLVAPEQLLVG
jgi:hypothetical protein